MQTRILETRKAGVNVRRAMPGLALEPGVGVSPGIDQGLMAQPAVCQETYKGGMKRDGAREALPAGLVLEPRRLPARGARRVLRKRGGYEYASQDLAVVKPG